MTAIPVARGASLQIQHIHKVFDHHTVAVESVSLDIAAGEFVSFLGPSGCGKSTLLRIIAGLESPTSGQVTIDPLPQKDLAFVFQDAHLLPWRSALGNVALPLELLDVHKAERTDRVWHALREVGLADAAHRYPAQLSGGMRMRVSLARAMVTSPRLLLLDEPFAALDELTRQRLDENLRDLWSRSGMTVLFVTHSINEAAYLSSRSIVFSHRPARVVLDRPIGLPLHRPADMRVSPPFLDETRVLFQALEGGER